ncbi:hypothetical protein T11_2488 [Trichinella zimbabwensis]|uniref:Uncharacterized protein n=1 Tax=Trichinella zimbabwensis TaxID=268475 RepID=A0A0V1HQ19_9BILA|nr:hypothetical protein T11_2488 [Trichinella zimbabwensis]
MIGILIDSKKNEDADDTKQSGKQREGGRPLVPQPCEEEVSCENMDFHHLRQLAPHGGV